MSGSVQPGVDPRRPPVAGSAARSWCEVSSPVRRSRGTTPRRPPRRPHRPESSRPTADSHLSGDRPRTALGARLRDCHGCTSLKGNPHYSSNPHAVNNRPGDGRRSGGFPPEVLVRPVSTVVESSRLSAEPLDVPGCTLMIPVGQPYRPAGTLDVRSILITTILGVTAAVIGAAVIWLWEWSPIPTLVIFTPIIQGLGVGGVMAFAVGRLRMRNPRFVLAVGCACGLLSVGLVHYGHYMTMVTAAAGEIAGRDRPGQVDPRGPAAGPAGAAGRRPGRIHRPDARPDDGALRVPRVAVLAEPAGHHDQERGRSRGSSSGSSGVPRPCVVVVMAAVVPVAVASRPFCEECGYWCDKQARPVHPAGGLRRPAGPGRPR